VIFPNWLTGYDEHSLQQQITNKTDMETFFKQSLHINPNAVLIKGVICGYRVEKIEDDLMRQISNGEIEDVCKKIR